MSKKTLPKGSANTTRTAQEFILARLSEMGKSQRWLANQLDTSQAHLNNWLRGSANCTREWITDRAGKFASALECQEIEILQRIPASIEPRLRAGPQSLNKNMLKALAEDEQPTDQLMEMMQRVEAQVGVPLNYEVCKELIKLSRSTT